MRLAVLLALTAAPVAAFAPATVVRHSLVKPPSPSSNVRAEWRAANAIATTAAADITFDCRAFPGHHLRERKVCEEEEEQASQRRWFKRGPEGRGAQGGYPEIVSRG